jgi:hypothetical protein
VDGIAQGRLASLLSLLTSSGTLVCCALPALLVTLGAGAALSSLIAVFPQIVWLSEHKVAIFVFAAAMLALAGFMQWRARTLPCPADPLRAAACLRTRRLSFRMYLISLGIFFIGGYFAFIAPMLAG